MQKNTQMIQVILLIGRESGQIHSCSKKDEEGPTMHNNHKCNTSSILVGHLLAQGIKCNLHAFIFYMAELLQAANIQIMCTSIL